MQKRDGPPLSPCQVHGGDPESRAGCRRKSVMFFVCLSVFVTLWNDEYRRKQRGSGIRTIMRIGLKSELVVYVPTSVDTQHFMQIHARVFQ